MQNHNIDIKEIIEIAIRAGNIAMQFYDRKYTVEQKQDKTPVTEADIAINDYLIKELSKYNFPILSEEIKDDFEKRKNAEYTWIIDPLDGTADFIQKTGEFSIMIGLINKGGESVLGVVYAPALDELYYAQKNKGAFLMKASSPLKGRIEERLESSQQLHVSNKKIKNKTSLRGAFSDEAISVSNKKIKGGKILTSRNHLGEYEQKIAKKYNMKQIPAGSAGLKICWIASGKAELYINSSNKSGLWDICAADIILREASGKIIDKNNNKILYNQREIMLLHGYIVSNRIHKFI